MTDPVRDAVHQLVDGAPPVQPIPGLCQRVGCGEIADVTIGVQVWAVGSEPRNDNYLVINLPLIACRGCAKRLRVKDVVGREGWRQIIKIVRQHGGGPPNRHTAQLYFTPVQSGNA